MNKEKHDRNLMTVKTLIRLFNDEFDYPCGSFYSKDDIKYFIDYFLSNPDIVYYLENDYCITKEQVEELKKDGSWYYE